MNHYIKGQTIKHLREQQRMTQLDLAEKLSVSDKTISKWETGRGLPDISLVEPLAKVLHVSIAELFAGTQIINTNKSANLLRSNFYVCPVCGNIIYSLGSVTISCCGISLPNLQAEEADERHSLMHDMIGYEHYFSIDHPMQKNHFISFIAYGKDNRFEIVKLYPESSAEAYFFSRGKRGIVYWYCNHHGLFYQRLK